MTFKFPFLAALLLTLAACAAPAERATVRVAQGEPAAGALLGELARVASLSAEQRRREITALDAERRLDDLRRFQLAALLERDDSAESLERSLKVLGALTGVDARSQPLVELMKRSIKARIELKQQTVRAEELQDKLDQIKALEKSLQQRSAPAQPQ